MLRRASERDISRIAEILIFAKRMAYRPIFRNDLVSFNEMQVIPLAENLSEPGKLERWLVYDDGIVRGAMEWRTSDNSRLDTVQIQSFFVDPFFQQMGYGRRMMEDFCRWVNENGYRSITLWVLEKNERARYFYQKAGFTFEGGRKLETGTSEYLLQYIKIL